MFIPIKINGLMALQNNLSSSLSLSHDISEQIEYIFKIFLPLQPAEHLILHLFPLNVRNRTHKKTTGTCNEAENRLNKLNRLAAFAPIANVSRANFHVDCNSGTVSELYWNETIYYGAPSCGDQRIKREHFFTHITNTRCIRRLRSFF